MSTTNKKKARSEKLKKKKLNLTKRIAKENRKYRNLKTEKTEKRP